MKDRVAIRVGVMSFLSILLIAALLLWKSGLFLSLKGYELRAVFPSINGLILGADVRYRGVKVGRVTKIEPSPEHITVTFWVADDIKVPIGSKIKVFFDGLIGEKFLNILPNAAQSTYLKPGEQLSGISSSGLAEFIEIGAENLQSTQHILNHYDTLLTSDEVTNRLLNTLKAIEEMAISLSLVSQELAVLSSRSSPELGQTVSNLLALSKTLKQSSDSLLLDGKLVGQIRSISSSFESSSAGIETMVNRLNRLVSSENIDDMNQAIQGVSGVAGAMRGATGWLHSVSQSRLSAKLDAAPISSVATGAHYLAVLDWGGRRQFIRGGMMGATSEGSSGVVAQLGQRWGRHLATRVGYVQSKMGGGVDWDVTDGLQLSLDVYDPDMIKTDVRGRWGMNRNTDLLLTYRKAKNDQDYGVGLGVSFKME